MKSTSIVSLGTLTSRILGFVRDIVLAKFFGTGLAADAFFVAQRIPNLLRDMVGEGASNSAIVPVLSEYNAKEKKEEFWRLVNVVFAVSLIGLSVLTLAGIIFTPVIVKIIAPGFAAFSGKLELTIRLTRLMFPYLILIGLTAHSMAVLFTLRSFASASFSPCLLNLAMIISIFLSVSFMQEPVYGLAIGVLVGGVLQLAVQFPPMFKQGMRWQFPSRFDHPGAIKIGKLLFPRMIGAGVYQMNVLIDTFCASLAFIVGPGGISAIYYANRIIQFPMGIFGFALASAVLPTLSNFAATNNVQQLKRTMLFAVENIFIVMLPMSIILMALATPITQILFERGKFDQYSTSITAMALMFYAVGLASFGGIKILVATFHSMQDTKTPVKVAALCLCITAILNFLLIGPLKVGGIALASAISATADFLILFYLLSKKFGGFEGVFGRFLFKALLATVLCGFVVNVAWNYWSFPSGFLKLILVGTLGGIVYFFACIVLGLEQARKVGAWAQGKILRG